MLEEIDEEFDDQENWNIMWNHLLPTKNAVMLLMNAKSQLNFICPYVPFIIPNEIYTGGIIPVNVEKSLWRLQSLTKLVLFRTRSKNYKFNFKNFPFKSQTSMNVLATYVENFIPSFINKLIMIL